MEALAANTTNNNDEAKIVINNTIENAKIPLLANVFARNIQSLNGQWNYLIDIRRWDIIIIECRF